MIKEGSPRFIDHNDGMVTDNLSGLMWTKNANLPGGTRTWWQALDYVAGMNAGTDPNYGYTDWRLPDINELESLIHAERFDPALPTGHPFSSVVNRYYWSSRTCPCSTDDAWFVNMHNGRDCVGSKSLAGYVWPVRDGQ